VTGQDPALLTKRVCHVCGFEPAPADSTTLCPNDGWHLVPVAEHRKHPTDAFLGRIVAGRYPVVGVLGSGGMGTVYRALQQPVGRVVALKVLKDAEDPGGSVRRRFENEAAVVARLKHPNVVTLHDFGVHEDATLFMVMELLEGAPLSAEIDRGPIPAERAAHIVAQVLDALVEAHALGLVHRDLKPGNVIAVPNRWGSETIKVLDFGIAKSLGSGVGLRERLTRSGSIIGTPSYMAPEQFSGGDVGPRADLYAMGVVLYECLCGRCPFEHARLLDIMNAHLDEEPAPLDPILGVPPALEWVALRALEKDPADRYPDAATMAAAVRDAADLAAPEPAIPPPEAAAAAGEAVPRPSTARRGLLALVLLVALAGAAWLLLRSEGGQRAAEPPPHVAGPSRPEPAAPVPEPPREPVERTAPAPEPTPASEPGPTVPPVPTVTVTLRSRPAGAVVLVEGERRGKTPKELLQPRSDRPRTVELRLPGYRVHRERVVWDESHTVEVRLRRELPPLKGTR